jgi:hypothetical protein
MRLRHALPAAAATLLLAAGAATLGVAPASAATVHPNCIVDGDGDCVQTHSGTAKAPAGLNIRNAPNTGAGIVGSMPYNSSGTVYCYSTGSNVNGDSYWDYIDYNGTSGYVSDYWLYTGGNINNQVDPC